MIGIIILIAIVVFLAVVLVRAARFVPKAQPELHADEVKVDEERAVKNLQQLVRCKTVSYIDHSLEDDAEFDKLLSLVPQLYPNVVSHCERIEVYKRALLFRWDGKSHGDPEAEASVFMAHFDVVPVEEENWEKPPFEGIIEDGVLWGRGTIDTKVTFNGILTAANELIGQGFVPENDIYLAFSGGEEINGHGAIKIVDYLKEKGVKLSMVIDEGGAVVENVFPGVSKSCALIGIAEKGLMDVKYSVETAGGHASAPKPHTPVGVLAKAVTKVCGSPRRCSRCSTPWAESRPSCTASSSRICGALAGC